MIELLSFAGHFRQCYDCPASKSFEDCQSQQKLINCSDNSDACFQTSVKYDNGSYKGEDFDSGCLDKSFCDRYKKGDIGYCNDLKAMNFTVECVSECCHKDGCNKEKLLVENKSSSFVIHVMMLLPGLLLAFVNMY